MTRSSQSQRQRTRQNPLLLGSFNQTSLRYLTGSLGPVNKVVGRADTNQYSNGGFGGGTYNHWFQINLEVPAWIVTRKGDPRPNYIQVSAYDLNLTPIQGRMIFQADSELATSLDGNPYYPYLGNVMGAGSNLYNEFNRYSIDKGNDLYFALQPSSYLICVSSTRNEQLDYSLGIVVEISTTEMFILLEDTDGDFLVQENQINTGTTIVIGPLFDVNYTIPPGFNGFTFTEATIADGVTVTISENSVWLIGFDTPEAPKDKFIIEPSESYDYNSVHEHSRIEWTEAWQRERSPGDALPEIFSPLITRP
jgi:hypothetical protein